LIGKDAFQEADVVGLTRACTKYNVLVRSVDELPRAIREAFHIATTGRPGPVLVDIPKDVLLAQAEMDTTGEIRLPGYHPIYEGNQDQIRAATDALLEAERPLILAGGGINHGNASAELRTFAEKLQIPVDLTLMGIGGFPPDHPLCLGMLGMHGTCQANLAIQKCDLLIGLGLRFDDRVTGKLELFAKQARVLHVDIDPTSIQKNVAAHFPVLGHIRWALQQFNRELDVRKAKAPATRTAWLRTLRHWADEYPLAYEPSDQVIKPQYALQEIARQKQPDAIVTTDVGQHQMWAAQYLPFRHPRSWITSGGLGTMGFGYPAALGAQMAFPERQVLAVVGDGGFQMTLQEIATAVEYKLPVKVLLINNQFLGMVRQWQELFYEERYSESAMVSPNFAQIAQAYGALGMTVSSPAELPARLSEALGTPGPVVLDIRVDPGENVYPMIKPGAAVDDMVISPVLKKALVSV
ncbi:MAG: biosynthetic-type acetolactate synthase large subunit, partial [Acidobacteriota bacterium]